eukprot:11959914-Ditylum_brightwellii.AAC.1
MAIQRELEAVVAKGILKGELRDGGVIYVDCVNGQLVDSKGINTDLAKNAEDDDLAKNAEETFEDMPAAFE